MRIIDNKNASLIVPDYGLYLVQSRYTSKKYISLVSPPKTLLYLKYRMVHLITDNDEHPVYNISYSWLTEKYNILYRINHIQMWGYEEVNNINLKSGVYFIKPTTLAVVKDNKVLTVELVEYVCNGESYFRVKREFMGEYESIPEQFKVYSIKGIESFD